MPDKPEVIDCDTVLEIIATFYRVTPSELAMCYDSWTQQMYIEFVEE